MTTTTEAVKGGDMVAPMVSSPTPWGYADEVDEVAEGIWFVSTMTHGGFWLDAQRNALVPAEIKAETYWQRGEAGWYEEDCDWAIVCLIFRPEFEVWTQRLGKNRDRSNTEAQLAQAEATFEWWRKKHGFGPSIRQAMLVPRLVEALRTAHGVLYRAKASGDDGVDDELTILASAIDAAAEKPATSPQ